MHPRAVGRSENLGGGEHNLAPLLPDIKKVKVWVFWEGHKIWKNLCRIFDKSVVFCARNSVLVKKSMKIFQNKCGQVVLYKL